MTSTNVKVIHMFHICRIIDLSIIAVWEALHASRQFLNAVGTIALARGQDYFLLAVQIFYLATEV